MFEQLFATRFFERQLMDDPISMALSDKNFGNCLFLRKFFSSYPFFFFLSYDTRLLESRGERAESIRGIVGDEEGTTPWGLNFPRWHSIRRARTI